MFSFFKRFRGSKSADNAPAEATTAPEADAPADAAQAAELPVAPAIPQATPTIAPPPSPAGQPADAGAAQTARAAGPGTAPEPRAAATEAQSHRAEQPQATSAAGQPAAVEPASASAQPASATSGPAAPQTPSQPSPAYTAPHPAARPVAPAVVSQPPAPTPVARADETVEIIPPPAPEPAEKKSWLARLKSGLSKTSSNITSIFVNAKIDDELYEELETALLMSDAGVDATQYLLDALRAKVRAERLTDAQQVKAALRSLLVELLKPLEKSLMLGRAQPLVMMITGVNGAGKTTSIGKLAKHLQRFDQSVLLAAGDTFRAAAREQLAIWGERNNVTVVSQESGDPAAVIFDAVGAARARGIDVLMADTAGRLPTQLHLMEELRKVKRVIGKALDGAPHEVLLVIDANTGQNALAQVKAFDDALGLTGLIVTKLDGTAKGGILAAIARQRPVPVYFIGVGEKVEDLQPFSADEFADALLGN